MRQHIEALALIFSGSFNNGKYYLDEDIPMSPFAYDEYEERSPSFDYGTLEVDLTPERHSTRSSLQTVDVIDNYVLDGIMEENRGFCSILVGGSVPLEMEFNLDATCDAPRIFTSLPGTHRWMLHKDMTRGELTVTQGSLVSVMSISPALRVVCCVESFTHSGILLHEPTQLYKLTKEHFRMPAINFSSPVSIDG